MKLGCKVPFRRIVRTMRHQTRWDPETSKSRKSINTPRLKELREEQSSKNLVEAAFMGNRMISDAGTGKEPRSNVPNPFLSYLLSLTGVSYQSTPTRNENARDPMGVSLWKPASQQGEESKDQVW
jgi:hypothetical protein